MINGARTLAAVVVYATILAGCAALPRLAVERSDFVEAARTVDSNGDKPPDLGPATAELIAPDDPDIQAAVKLWKETGRAPIIRRDDFLQYPYGLTEAVVACHPLRVCDVELEAGEEVTNLSLGDSARWLASPASSGERETLTPHVLLKPTEIGIATNAVITTTRRTYYLALVSTPKSDPSYVRRVKFYYPHDFVQHVGSAARAAAAQRRQEQETIVAHVPRVAIDALNFDYRLEGADVPWKPVRVFDDGTHVYIQMPPAMRVTEAPVLLVETRTGDTALVNYRLRQNYYVVDKLFDTALLVVGVGAHQERVTIRRGRAPR